MDDADGRVDPFEALDERALTEIFVACDLKSLLQLRQTCRRAREVGDSALVWTRRVLLDFGGVRLRRGVEHAAAVYRALHDAAHGTAGVEPAAIRFRGVFTDGGLDDGAGPAASPSTYWVDHMFSPSPYDAFCSALGANVACVAVLDQGHSAADAAAEAQRAFLVRRCQLAAALMFAFAAAPPGGPGPGSDVAQWSRAELEAFFLQLVGLSEAGHPMGALLYHGLAPDARAAEEARVAALVQQLQAQRSTAPEQDALYFDPADSNRVWALDPRPSRGGALALVRAVTVSRVGQFSCPVSAGAVLLGSLAGLAAAPSAEAARAAVADAAAHPAVAALRCLSSLEAVQAAAAEGALPPLLRIGQCAAGQWAEFAPPPPTAPVAARALSPAFWFCFTTRAAARAEDASAGVDPPPGGRPERDRLQLRLLQPRACDVAVVLLISSENLMSEFNDDHEAANIDVNACTLRGGVALLPEAVELDDAWAGA